jgi:hypothetical protein
MNLRLPTQPKMHNIVSKVLHIVRKIEDTTQGLCVHRSLNYHRLASKTVLPFTSNRELWGLARSPKCLYHMLECWLDCLLRKLWNLLWRNVSFFFCCDFVYSSTVLVRVLQHIWIKSNKDKIWKVCLWFFQLYGDDDGTNLIQVCTSIAYHH